MIIIKNGCVSIPISCDENYEIAVSDCDEYSKILACIINLVEKDWVTKETINEFINVVLDHQRLYRPSI